MIIPQILNSSVICFGLGPLSHRFLSWVLVSQSTSLFRAAAPSRPGTCHGHMLLGFWFHQSCSDILYGTITVNKKIQRQRQLKIKCLSSFSQVFTFTIPSPACCAHLLDSPQWSSLLMMVDHSRPLTHAYSLHMEDL